MKRARKTSAPGKRSESDSRAQPEGRASQSDLGRVAGNQAFLALGERALPPGLSVELERLYGSRLGDVKLHTGPGAAELAADAGARAFTVGRHIVFGEGQFAPTTSSGRALLAHELAHVLQQRAATGRSRSARGAEQEAQQAGAAAARGVAPSVTAAVPVGVQKDDDKKKKTKKAKAQTERRRAQALKGMTPEQRRSAELVEESATLQERHGGDKATHYQDEERANVRTKRSEAKRHQDTLDKVRGHHGFPKYLGGAYEQTLIGLGEDLHYLYHEELDRVLKVPRKLGSSYYKKLTPEQRADLFRRLIEHAEGFDRRYRSRYPDKRTRVAAALRRGIKDAGFEVPKAAAKTSASKKAPKSQGKPAPAKAPPKPAAKPSAKPASAAKPAAAAKPSAAKPKAAAKTPAKPVTAVKPSVPAPVKAPAVTAKVPRVPAVPAVPRVGRAVGGGLAGAAASLLMIWLGSKLDVTSESIERDIKAHSKRMDDQIAGQALAIEAMLAADPSKPVYANITVVLEYWGANESEPMGPVPIESYAGVKTVVVTVSRENIDKYIEAEREYNWKRPFMWERHPVLIYSVPLEMVEAGGP